MEAAEPLELRYAPASGEPAHDAASADKVLERIAAELHGLLYGTLLIVVQDGVVVRIERTAKYRLR